MHQQLTMGVINAHAIQTSPAFASQRSLQTYLGSVQAKTNFVPSSWDLHRLINRIGSLIDDIAAHIGQETRRCDVYLHSVRKVTWTLQKDVEQLLSWGIWSEVVWRKAYLLITLDPNNKTNSDLWRQVQRHIQKNTISRASLMRDLKIHACNSVAVRTSPKEVNTLANLATLIETQGYLMMLGEMYYGNDDYTNPLAA